MTATYTNDPENVPKDAVRFLLYDRDTVPETDALLSDEEIGFLIAENANVYLAASLGAIAIAAKHGDNISQKKVGDLWITDARPATWTILSEELRKKGIRSTKGFAGGLTISGKTADYGDDDRVQPDFKRGMHDNRGDSGDGQERGLVTWT